MNFKQLIKFGLENSSDPVIKNPILRDALEPRSMDQAALVDELEPGAFKDEMLGKFDPDQETHEEYLQRINLERPFNMAEGGQLVAPSVDGLRPGYSGEVDRGFYQKIIDNYKNSVAKDFASGDMSKTGSWRNYLKKKYPKNWKKIQNTVLKSDLQAPTRYQFSFKNKLMKNLINEANKGERFVDMKEIYDKVSSPVERGDRPGQLKARSLKEMGEWVDPKLPKLQTQEQKILKVFDNIIKNNEVLELKDPNFKFIKNIKEGTEIEANLLRKIIGERTGTGSYNTIAAALEKHPKMKQKKFRKIFDYMSRAHVSDFEGYRFKDAFDYATDRRSGAAYFTNVNKNIMYKNPDVNIMSYALRHWDGNNFNDQPSRIQFFDKKTGDPIKWKSGLRLSPKNVYFTMDGNPMQWNTQTLKTHGKASGLFDEVVDITNSYYKTYNKLVPDGKGGTIKFGDLVGKNNMAIGHNAPGGVKAEPFKNFQLQSKKMNTALYHATKHIKNKDLQKRVIGNIYGSLNNLKGDKYINEFIKNFPTTGYKEAGQKVITEAGTDFLQWGPKKRAEILRIAGIDLSTPEGRLLLKDLKALCPKGKASGGRIGFAEGPATVACGANELNRLLKQGKGNTPLVKKILQGGGNLLKEGIRQLNPKEVLRLRNLIGPAALGFMAAYEGGVITDDVLRKGTPLNESVAKNWLTKSFVPFSEEFARQKNLLQSGTLTDNQKIYALDMMKAEKAFKEMDRIEGMEANQLIEGTMDDDFIFNSQEDIDAAKTNVNRILGDLDSSGSLDNTGMQMENIRAMDEMEASRMAKKEYSKLFGKWGTPLVNKLATPAGRRMGPMTAKREMNIDYSLPTYDRMPTPTDQDILNTYRQYGVISPTEFKTGVLQPGEGTLIRMMQGGEGLYGSQFAGGGIASIRRPHAIPPESGPTPQGLPSMLNRVKRI